MLVHAFTLRRLSSPCTLHFPVSRMSASHYSYTTLVSSYEDLLRSLSINSWIVDFTPLPGGLCRRERG